VLALFQFLDHRPFSDVAWFNSHIQSKVYGKRGKGNASLSQRRSGYDKLKIAMSVSPISPSFPLCWGPPPPPYTHLHDQHPESTNLPAFLPGFLPAAKENSSCCTASLTVREANVHPLSGGPRAVQRRLIPLSGCMFVSLTTREI